MAKTVFARGQFFAAGKGGPKLIQKGEAFSATHPIVKAYPDSFESLEDYLEGKAKGEEQARTYKAPDARPAD